MGQVLGQAFDVGEPFVLIRVQLLRAVDEAVVLALRRAMLTLAVLDLAIRNVPAIKEWVSCIKVRYSLWSV